MAQWRPQRQVQPDPILHPALQANVANRCNELLGFLVRGYIGPHVLVIKITEQRDFPKVGQEIPQVAQEYGWDRKLFLEQTCLKAGLPANALEDKETKLFFFDSFCFSEED